MNRKPTFITNFPNGEQGKVAQVFSVTGPNFYREELATDKFRKILPHCFSVWSKDGTWVEFWAVWELMFPNESIDEILTKWSLKDL